MIQTIKGKTKGKASVIEYPNVSDNEGNNPVSISKVCVKEMSINIIIIIINSFKAQFQTAQCAMQLWNNTGAKILHAYMKLYNIQIYMKAKYNRRKYL